MKTKTINKILEDFACCDVILKNGYENFVGLYYVSGKYEQPELLFKCNFGMTVSLFRIAELMDIPCVESKVLTQSLFENVKEGYYIHDEYISSIAAIYSHLPRYLEREEDDLEKFRNELNINVLDQLYNLEKKNYKKAERKVKQKVDIRKDKIDEEKTDVFFYKEFSELGKNNNFDFSYKDDGFITEFYLNQELVEFDYNLWHRVIVSVTEQKIFLVNRCILKCFDIQEAKSVADYVREMVEIDNESLCKSIKNFCKEFDISPKLFDIADNSIRTFLEINFISTGIEYGIDDSEKTVFMVYLRDKEDSSKMYTICITYAEFMRNTEEFWKVIAKPRVFEKWNFWCKKRKFCAEKFKKIKKNN